MITKPCRGLLASAFFLIPSLTFRAAELVYEPVAYTTGSNLTSQTGGSGWTAGWIQDPSPMQSRVIGADGLTYADALGIILNVAGKRADTTGTATTR